MAGKSIVLTLKTIYQKITKEKILYDIQVVFLLLLPIFITADKYLKWVGTILTGVPFILGIICVLLYQKKKRIKYIIVGILLAINAFIIKDYKEQFEYIKSFIIMLTCFDLVHDSDFLKVLKNYLERYYKFITISIAVILVLNGCVLFSGQVESRYADMWNIEAFEGLYYDPNQAAYRLCALIVYILFFIKAKKNNVIINIIMLLVTEFYILQTGARTPTGLGIALGMIAIYFLKDEIEKILNKNKIVSIILAIIVGIALGAFLPQTSFVQKNLVSSEGTFDNGRTILRDAGWKYFVNSNIQNKLFGNDIRTIYKINTEVMHAPIWSHNDIIQILLQFGMLMLIVYIATIVEAMIYHLKGEKKFDKFVIALLYFVFLFVAFYNGLFYHPRFVVSIPILFVAYKMYNNETKKDEIEGEK